LIVVTYSRPVAALAAMPLHVLGSRRRHVLRRNAAARTCTRVDVVHEHADAAVLDVVADAGSAT
jgi:hypothetical protein